MVRGAVVSAKVTFNTVNADNFFSAWSKLDYIQCARIRSGDVGAKVTVWVDPSNEERLRRDMVDYGVVHGD